MKYIKGNLFIISDYQKSTLQSIMLQDKNNNFKEEHLILIVYNLLCAVKQMHSSNIIYRDINPENILINE
jgi:serine/threonine protein kinase